MINIKGAEMRRPITVFVAIFLHACTYQGPVKEIITEKRTIRANTYMQGGNYEDAIANFRHFRSL
jgi:hypothetical protein